MAPLRVGKKFQVTVPQGLALEVGWNVGEHRYGAVCHHRFEIEAQPGEHHAAVRLRERNQITLPVDVCRRLMIVEGGLIEMRVEDDRLVISPAVVTVSGSNRQLPKEGQQRPISDEFSPLEPLKRISKRARRVASRRKWKT